MDENKKQLILDYQEVFGPGDGERVRADLESRFNYNQSFALAVSSGNIENVMMELGKREAYLYIIDKIGADPNAQTQESSL